MQQPEAAALESDSFDRVRGYPGAAGRDHPGDSRSSRAAARSESELAYSSVAACSAAPTQNMLPSPHKEAHCGPLGSGAELRPLGARVGRLAPAEPPRSLWEKGRPGRPQARPPTSPAAHQPHRPPAAPPWATCIQVPLQLGLSAALSHGTVPHLLPYLLPHLPELPLPNPPCLTRSA